MHGNSGKVRKGRQLCFFLYGLCLKLRVFIVQLSNNAVFSLLSPDYLELICKLLSMSKTRFTLKYMYLEFRKLSECLKVLSLWERCFDLNWLILLYKNVDIDSAFTVLRRSIAKFKKQTSFFGYLKVSRQ